MIKKTNYAEIRVTIKMVYPTLIKVRAYTRIRLGKKENVRALIGRLFCPLCFHHKTTEKTSSTDKYGLNLLPSSLRIVMLYFSVGDLIIALRPNPERGRNEKL